jgi:purine-binding chemotaxis protein CheW
MNLRGHVVTVVDLGQLMGLDAGRPIGRILVLDRGRSELGLAVNDVMGTADLEIKARAPANAPPFVTSVGQDEKGAVTLVDSEALDSYVGSIFNRSFEKAI